MKDDPKVYVDDKGRLTQEYPKKDFTKKRAIGIIEIKNIAFHPNYKEGAIWVDDHSKDSWIWYQRS
jgi:hypothetical protein